MNDKFWETVKGYIPEWAREKALHDLQQVGLDRFVELPGFGKAEREGRRVIAHSGKEYLLTPSQVLILINIASEYPACCTMKNALKGRRSIGVKADKNYLRVVLSKLKSTYPELKDHIESEKWTGYRWVKE